MHICLLALSKRPAAFCSEVSGFVLFHFWGMKLDSSSQGVRIKGFKGLGVVSIYVE